MESIGERGIFPTMCHAVESIGERVFFPTMCLITTSRSPVKKKHVRKYPGNLEEMFLYYMHSDLSRSNYLMLHVSKALILISVINFNTLEMGGG